MLIGVKMDHAAGFPVPRGVPRPVPERGRGATAGQLARRAERAFAWPLAAACAWEAAALATGRIPTLTQLCRRHRRWLAPAAATLLAVHLWFAPPWP